MYSTRLMQFFQTRTHAGMLERATHYGEAGVPGHGPYVCLWLRVEDEIVLEARFKTYGCPAVVACSEALCAWGEGKRLTELVSVTTPQVLAWVGGVPEGKEHCPALALDAVRSLELLAEPPRRQPVFAGSRRAGR